MDTIGRSIISNGRRNDKEIELEPCSGYIITCLIISSLSMIHVTLTSYLF